MFTDFYSPQAEPGAKPLAPPGGLYFLHYREATHRKNTLLGGIPEDGLLEKGVENKSVLKFNFKKLLFSILFSRMYRSGNMDIRQIHVVKTENIYILQFNDFLSNIFNLSLIDMKTAAIAENT